MAEYQVNIAELQEICDYVINADYPYFEELREAFKLLRHTGCREMEIFEIQRWSQVSGNEFTLTPQKGNNNRTIILGEDFTNFKAAILGQYPPFLGRTYSQLQNLFKRVCPYWPIYSGGKQITLYTFRYLFLHELKADGLTNQQIANIMGHVNVETVSNYLDAILSSENEVPVEPSDPIPEGHIDIFTENTSFDGTTDNFLIDNPALGEKFTLFFKGSPTNTSNSAILNAPNFHANVFYPAIFVYLNNSLPYFQFRFDRSYYIVTANVAKNGNLPLPFKFCVSADFSQIGSSGGTFRDIYFKYSIDGVNFETRESINENTFYPQPNQLLIGCRKNPSNTISQPYAGTFEKYLLWSRILSESEMQSLFSL